MNRATKFKVWDKTHKRFIQDNTDFTNRKGYNLGIYALTPHGELLFFESSEGGMDTHLREDVEIVRSTGLLDKNGKEIWEGDVLEVKQGEKAFRHEVVFAFGTFGIIFPMPTSHLKPLHEMTGNTLSERLARHEVIGNIYENPKLLK